MRVFNIVKYVFSVVGVVMLVGAFFWYNSSSDFSEKAVSTEGTVVDLVLNRSRNSRTYSPVVQFENETGRKIEFKSQTGSNPPAYSRGENVEVLYLPANPERAKINSFFSLWGGVSILAGLGAIFFMVGAGMIIYPIIKIRRDEHLQKNGRRIETDFQEVVLNESYSVNGRHPFQLVSQWQNPVTNKIHVFRSNNLWFDPTDYVDRDKITVFIDQVDPESYYMDTSFLPEAAE